MERKKIVLAIETAIGTGSISIIKDAQEIVFVAGERTVSRSEDLLQVISAALTSVRLNLTNIKLIAVSTGPGSFTGIRVGIATAQALAFGLDCDLVGISVFEALACCARNEKKFMTILPAGRNLFYWQKNSAANKNNQDKSLNCVGTRDELTTEISNLKHEFDEIITEFRIRQEIGSILSTLPAKKINLIVASDNISGLIGQAAIVSSQKESGFKKPLVPFYIREATAERAK